MSNIIIITGRLSRDPEMRYTPKGTAVCSFSVADNDYNKNVTWWKVTAWEKLAETCNEYLKKGRQVQVVGTVKPGEDGNPQTFKRSDGSTGSSFEVTARTVEFFGGEQQESGRRAPSEEDDIPPF